jgi:hypothetical protein
LQALGAFVGEDSDAGSALGGISVGVADPDCVAGNVGTAEIAGVPGGDASERGAQAVNRKSISRVSDMFFSI